MPRSLPHAQQNGGERSEPEHTHAAAGAPILRAICLAGAAPPCPLFACTHSPPSGETCDLGSQSSVTESDGSTGQPLGTRW
eukprot:scaffold6781_cov107-Isochrysis_galbana.AAC.3